MPFWYCGAQGRRQQGWESEIKDVRLAPQTCEPTPDMLNPAMLMAARALAHTQVSYGCKAPTPAATKQLYLLCALGQQLLQHPHRHTTACGTRQARRQRGRLTQQLLNLGQCS